MLCCPNGKGLRVRARLILHLFAVLAGAQLLLAQGARADNVAILYPEIREPYRQLFLSIVDGVRGAYRGQVMPYELSEKTNAEDLPAWLAAQHVDAVIALGNRSVTMLPSLPPSMPAVVGAVLVDPDHQSFSGVSLAPSPHRLFAQLQQLQPQVKTVHVIYLPGSGNWLIDQARSAAADLHLELADHKAEDVYTLAQRYRDVLSHMDSDKDALWIAYDGRGLDDTLLEQLLETAWQRRLLVFSSNLVDVKRGVLFALYPDNKAMGQQLLDMVARARREHRAVGTIDPVDSLLSAVNLRTADHLELHFTAPTRQGFSMTLP